MIYQTTINGIPALQAPGDGPTRGGLTFRVGQADEPLSRAGITHLIEHLALHRLGLTDYHFNGATGSTVTHFYSQGSPDDVGEYLNNVSAALNDLPLDRLPMEKDILRTEAAGKGHSPAEPMLLWRYGARGYGVSSYPEWGLGELTPDDLRAWIARYFTSNNAVLWFSGSIPANLKVSLAPGVRQPLPAVTSALPTTPAWFEGPPRTVAMHTVVGRSAAAQVYADVLERELFRALRQEGGFSYTAATGYEPIDKDTAAIIALADANPEKQDAALGAFVDVVAKLRWGTFNQIDLDATKSKVRETLSDPEIDGQRLPQAAFNLLIDGPMYDVAEVIRQVDAVTLNDLRPIAEAAAANALLMVPEDRRADWAGYTAAPTDSPAPLMGATHQMRGDGNVALIVGSEGVSITHPGGTVTVRYAECSVALAYPDGGRLLIGHDGITCRVEPTLYAIDPATMASIDAGVRAVTVRMPARDPDSIPQPAPLNQLRGASGGGLKSKADTDQFRAVLGEQNVPVAAASAGATATAAPGKYYGLTIAGLIVFAVLSVFCGLISIAGTPQWLDDPELEGGARGVVLFLSWGGTAALVTVTVLLVLRLRRHRP